MWPIILAILRRNAVYVTLPFAAFVGFVGFQLEGVLSDKYTPYSESIQEKRAERLSDDDSLINAADKISLINFNVLERNLPTSLKKN